MRDPTRPFLETQRALILDGGLATELEYRGADLDDPLWSARVLLERPELIVEVHRDYLEAGADCVVGASYQASFEALVDRGLDSARAEQALRRSVELAAAARDAFWDADRDSGERLRPLVAASVGPYGAFLADGSEYRGDYGLGVDELAAFHRARLEVLSRSGADLLAIETIPCRPEAVALARLLDASDGVVAWMSFSCRDDSTLNDGTPIERVVEAVESCERIVAIGVNCTAPELVESLLRRAATVTAKPLVAYPNSGEGYDAESRCWIPAKEMRAPATLCLAWSDAGARLVGGCCRTRPADIRAIRRTLLGASGGGAREAGT
jgi:homocysteine S-methyltransferase